jgi:hypothetical protein
LTLHAGGGVARQEREPDMRSWIFVLAFALVLYGNGAAVVETVVTYPSWRLIGRADFPAYHRFIGPRVIASLVAPALLGTVCTLLLVRFRPPGLPAGAVWIGVLLQAVVWLSTVTLQVPMQHDLAAHGYSAAVVDRLIGTSWWLRRVPYAACAVLFLWMGARVAGRARSG